MSASVPPSSPPSLTWKRLSLTVAARYPLATNKGNALRFVCELGKHRTRIGMQLSPFSTFDEPKVEVAADLGMASQVDPWDALTLNTRLSFGALAVTDNVLFLRAKVQLIDTTEDAVLALIKHVAAEGARIRRYLRAPIPENESTFSHYGE